MEDCLQLCEIVNGLSFFAAFSFC